MHNALTRLQNTFGFMTTCAFTLAGLIAFISLIPLPAPTSLPTATIAVRDVQVVKGRPHYYSTKREEYAQIKFDLDADLSGLFTWNTKQIFVYVTVVYPPSSREYNTFGQDLSQAVIWDDIITAPASPYNFANLKARYWPSNTNTKNRKSKKTSSTPKKNKKAAEPKTKALVRPGVIHLQGQKPKYQITDPSGVLSERRNATLELNWNVQPWVGALVWDKGYLGSRVGSWAAGGAGKSKAFDFPPLKGSRAAEARKEREAESPKPEPAEALPVVDV